MFLNVCVMVSRPAWHGLEVISLPICRKYCYKPEDVTTSDANFDNKEALVNPLGEKENEGTVQR